MTPRLSILIYHRVLPARDPLLPGVPDVATFNRHMALLKRLFRVLPLGDAVAHLRAGTLPSRSACITFDDGYADNLEHALPILLKHGLPACFFIASGYLDGGIMWNDRVTEHVRAARGKVLDLTHIGCGRLPTATPIERAAAVRQVQQRLKYLPFEQREETASKLEGRFPTTLMLSCEQLRRLHSHGMEIGAHTHRHPILSQLPERQALDEILGGKVALERILGDAVTLFAYPNGKPVEDYLPCHVDMVRAAGFQAAVSTTVGAAASDDKLFELPRYTPWQSDRPRFALGLLQNAFRLRA